MSVKQKFIDLVLRGKDLFSPAAKSASAELNTLSAEAKESSDQLKALQTTQEKLLKARGIELYAEQAEKALAGARVEVSRLAREIDASDKPTKEQAEALKLASRSANQLQTEYNKLASQLSRAKGDLQQAGVNTDRLADEQNRLQTEIRQSASALSEKRTKLRDMRGTMQETEKATESFGSKIGGATKQLLGFVGAYVGLTKLKDSLVSILSTADQLESYSFQFAALFGGIEQGEQATQWVQDFARNTGTRIGNVRDAFVQLKTFGIDPMNGSLQALVDYNAKLGGSQEKLQGIILAVGQAWGKQKLQGEEILQLVERGVPVWDLLAQATGKSTAELQKLSTAGKLGRDAIAALVSELGNAAAGMSEAGLDRLGGQINIVANNWERFQQLIADSGLYQTAVQFLKDLNAEFDTMANNGQLQKAAQDVSDFFSRLITSSGDSLRAFTESVSGLLRFISGVSGAVRIFVNGLSSALFMTAAAFTGTISQMIATLANFADAVGATDIASKLQEQANAIWAVRNAYWEQFNQDSADIAAGWQQVTDAITGSSNIATQTIKQNAVEQKDAIAQVQSAEEQRAAKAAELSQLMAKANITTLGSLQELEKAAKATYDAVAEGAASGVASSFELEQAFNAWAESALKLAAANKSAVPETLRLQAAQLGLGNQLDDLIRKQGLSAEVTDKQSSSIRFMRDAVDKTLQSINRYQRTLSSTAATEREKAAAAMGLAEAQRLLTVQQEDLTKAQELGKKSFFEITLELEKAQLESERLNQSYRAGTITTEQYSAATARLIALIQYLKELQGGGGQSTKDMGDKQDEAGKKTDKTTESVKKQAKELKSLSDSTEKSTSATSLLAIAQQYLTKEFDFSETSTQDLGKRYQELTGFIRQNLRVTNEWWRELALASNEGFTREQQIISETLKIRDYTKTLESSGVTMEQVRRIQTTLNYGFAQLGDNDLAPLRNAIADAERRILSLRDGLQGTVSSLQDELDRLNDNQAAIEKRRYDAQVAELREKLQQAQSSGDQQAVKAAQEALKLAQQIYKIKTDQLAAERSAAQGQTQDTNQQGQQPTSKRLPKQPAFSGMSGTSSTTQNSSTGATVRVELALPSGRVIPAQATQSDAAALMDELERIRSTSL
ncbi:MAG: tape measure protein [Gammaproteobacteria bacterium]|nr:tape measure protein [Gammaproteobacteria bacterium]